MSDAAAGKTAMTLAVYKRPFEAGGHKALVTLRARMDGLHSELAIDGQVVATDHTPAIGPEAVRNHRLTAVLGNGRILDVEAGYISWLSVGIAVTIDGARTHESHPGKRIAYPAKAAAMAVKDRPAADPTHDLGVFKRNRAPIAVDIALTILFYIVAKTTDLSTAALVGAAVGIGLVIVQRFIKTDILGGLALFGIVMLLISAGLAIAFQDDFMVKMRTTIVGTISAGLFLTDGLLGQGKRLGAGMARYLPYNDIDPRRLAIGVGTLGLVMAALNYVVARVASTDFWLIYHSVLDTVVFIALMFGVYKYARTGTPRVVA